jgi:hypothetical protein
MNADFRRKFKMRGFFLGEEKTFCSKEQSFLLPLFLIHFICVICLHLRPNNLGFLIPQSALH